MIWYDDVFRFCIFTIGLRRCVLGRRRVGERYGCFRIVVRDGSSERLQSVQPTATYLRVRYTRPNQW